MNILILNIPTLNFTMTGDELIVFTSCCGKGVSGRTSDTLYRGQAMSSESLRNVSLRCREYHSIKNFRSLEFSYHCCKFVFWSLVCCRCVTDLRNSFGDVTTYSVQPSVSYNDTWIHPLPLNGISLTSCCSNIPPNSLSSCSYYPDRGRSWFSSISPKKSLNSVVK